MMDNNDDDNTLVANRLDGIRIPTRRTDKRDSNENIQSLKWSSDTLTGTRAVYIAFTTQQVHDITR